MLQWPSSHKVTVVKSGCWNSRPALATCPVQLPSIRGADQWKVRGSLPYFRVRQYRYDSAWWDATMCNCDWMCYKNVCYEQWRRFLRLRFECRILFSIVFCDCILIWRKWVFAKPSISIIIDISRPKWSTHFRKKSKKCAIGRTRTCADC